MKIVDGLKLKGFPAEIPDASRDDLPGFFVDMGFKAGVEVGVCDGRFTEKLCKAGLKIYGVDSWTSYDSYKDNYKNHKDYMMGFAELHDTAVRKLAPYDCTLIKKFSMDAAGDFEDGSIDFVYIDGNHSFRYVAEDLFEWSKKVRNGGIVSGHDYYISKNSKRHIGAVHVKPVVDAFVHTFKVPNFWVLGNRFAPGRDEWRSFLWIKE